VIVPICLAVVSHAQAASAQILSRGVADSAKSVEDVKKSLPLADKWMETAFAERKFLFAVTNEGDGESYIEVHGWIYNRSYKEWRRVLSVATRSVGNAELLVDNQMGTITLREPPTISSKA